MALTIPTSYSKTLWRQMQIPKPEAQEKTQANIGRPACYFLGTATKCLVEYLICDLAQGIPAQGVFINADINFFNHFYVHH